MVYEEKADKISELLEELILDAMLSVLRKLKERNVLFDELLNKHNDTEEVRF